MGIKLMKRKAEASTSTSEFQAILDSLARLYSNGVQFKYDANQKVVAVTKGDKTIGTVRSEGALHTIIWATLSLAEKKA